ncbi:hypothetical protein [Nonomuraea sp. NPDC005692]|uniref:hypothetical protein n=1 Tax=Nonomuraea sp. NPDC005692 TaxID=3157168 RepID=UPI0033E59AF6
MPIDEPIILADGSRATTHVTSLLALSAGSMDPRAPRRTLSPISHTAQQRAMSYCPAALGGGVIGTEGQ